MEDVAKKRPLSATDVADWFINRIDRQEGEVITALMVQRLVYFAQAWFLANKGRPLFADDFEAWPTGPVVRSIFERFENFAYANVPAMDVVREIKGEKLDLLEDIHERYGCYRVKKLEELSQEEGGPWQTSRGSLAPEVGSSNVIPKYEIKKFYGAKIGKVWA